MGYTAGTQSIFVVQGRDFYSNNIVTMMSGVITDYKVEFRDPVTNQTILTGNLIDDSSGPGVFQVQFTPTLAGSLFHMYIQFNGLDVDSSPYDVQVVPAL